MKPVPPVAQVQSQRSHGAIRHPSQSSIRPGRRRRSQPAVRSLFLTDGSQYVICLKASRQTLKAPAMSRWGLHLKWISNRGESAHSTSVCVSALLKEDTSQRDRTRQSDCIRFARFCILQLYLTCFCFSFSRPKCTYFGRTCCHPRSHDAIFNRAACSLPENIYSALAPLCLMNYSMPGLF